MRPGPDGVSPFEAMFGVRPRSSHEPPEVEYVASNTALFREFEVAAMKATRASRIVAKASPPEANFKVEDMVLMRRGKNTKGAKLLRQDWSGPFMLKKVNHPRYILENENQRKSRKPIHVRRLRRYVQCEYGPQQGTSSWYRSHTEGPCGTN